MTDPRQRGERLPFRNRIPRTSYLVDVAPDTGGYLRPDWRPQDPANDPREPWSGESGGTGTDHGWSNCTMASAALAYALDAGKQSGPWGGDFRHNQDDLSGGTDLYDARTAWQRYGGRELTIRNGSGWASVEQARAELRPIVIQGQGNVPGSEAFDGGHACAISPEPSSDGRWLFGDPLANGWQWVSPSHIRTWAQALSSGIYYAVGSRPVPSEGDDEMGIQLTMVEPLDAEATVRGDLHSWIRVWDGHWGQVPDGFGPKQVYGRATLKTNLTTPGGGGTIPAGTRVVLIGDDLAFFVEADVTLTYPTDPDPDDATDAEIAEAVDARDAEWIAHLTPD